MSHWEFNQPASAPAPVPALPSSVATASLVERWEQLAPLSDAERQSVHAIQKAVAERPLPASIALRSNSTTALAYSHLSPTSTRSPSPSHSLQRLFLHSGSRPDLSLEPITNPIASIEAFNDWFSSVSAQIDADSESDYLSHLATLATYAHACDALDRAIDDCRALLREVAANWRFVDENCRSLERSCEGMLDEQKTLCSLASALEDRLGYFRRLDLAQRVLSMPGEAEIVTSSEFLPMVDQLDLCLEFMRTNRHFRDADLYLVRFQQCLTRSMTLIKLHYTNLVRTLGRLVAEKLHGKDDAAASPLIDALLYAKFDALAAELRPLVGELEKRCRADPDEYGALLQECFSTWFAVRRQLLSGRLRTEIARIEISHSQLPDLLKLATTGCNHLRIVCRAEWDLFKSFFASSGEEELFAYLESLCDYLYDLLRPQILHEQKLDVLCDLATIANALIAMDSELIDESASADAFKFSGLLKPVLQDVQTRLVFRAQAIVQGEVAHYQPRPEDLDYPAKLVKKNGGRAEMKRAPASKAEPQSVEPRNAALRFRLPPEEVQEKWYPSLRKTLWVLSKLHTYVNDAIFEDFAGEAVGICSQSIIAAAALIDETGSQGSSRGSGRSLDSQLFVIRHLLILKEMIRTLDVVQVERAVDLGPITDVLKELLNPSTAGLLLFRPTNLLERLSRRALADFGQKTIDSKSELDKRLKSTCQEFISQTARGIGGPTIEAFMARCQVFLNLSGGLVSRDLPSQEWATSEIVKEVYRNYAAQLEAGVRGVLNKMVLYLEDERTVNVIFPPLQEEILERYQQYYKFIKSEYDSITVNGIGNEEDVKKVIEGMIYEAV